MLLTGYAPSLRTDTRITPATGALTATGGTS